MSASDLEQRLEFAEKVCRLFGITATGPQDCDEEKALTQAWQEWQHRFGRELPKLSEAEIHELAARRDITRDATAIRLHLEHGGFADGINPEDIATPPGRPE